MVKRGLAILLLVVLSLAGIHHPAAAQDNPQSDVEARALAVHLQNLRTHSYTYWIGGNMGDPASSLGDLPALGQVFDNWSLEGMNGHDPVSFSDIKRPVLLNFWASWCPPCRLEFPHMTDIALAPQDHNFDVLFVNTSDFPGDAAAFLSMQSPDIHVVLDKNDQLWNQLQGTSLPTSFLLGADGKVLVIHIGMMTPTVAAFLDAVSANPGVGSFNAADHPSEPPGADLAPIVPGDEIPVQFGTEMNGEITETHTQDVYRFDGKAGDQITVSTKGFGDLDTYLVLMTEDGQRLAENDDAEQGSTNSRIDATLPADGTYLVVVTRFLEAEGFGGGRYTVEFTTSSPSESGGQSSNTSTGTTIAYGDTVSGSLTDTHYEDRWTFDGKQGDVISVVMSSQANQAGGLDGYLILQGPDGSSLVEVDDGPNSTMPELDSFSLPADGTYTLVATRFGFANGGSVGDYTLTLEKQGSAGASVPSAAGAGSAQWFSPDSPPPGLRPITYNHPVQGVIDEENQDDWFIFRGRAGDQLTIQMSAESSDLDSFLILTDASGYEVGRNDDAEGGMADAALADFALPADGTYFVRATRYGFANGPSSGSYSLLIQSDAESLPLSGDEVPVSLPFGVPTSGSLSASNMGDLYTFQGKAGDVVTISARGTGVDTGLSLRGQDGGELIYSSSGNTPDEARIQNFVLPQGGSYTLDVLLEDLSTSGDYQVLVLSMPQTPLETTLIPEPGLDIEIVLSWQAPVDLDLAGVDPNGDAGARDQVANDFCAQADPAPTERLTWAKDAAPGSYQIEVQYQFNCGGLNVPAPFTLVLAQHGAVIRVINGTLAGEGDRYSVTLNFPPE